MKDLDARIRGLEGWRKRITAPDNTFVDLTKAFPGWQDYVPATIDGWSSNPANSVYKYLVIGSFVVVRVHQGADGTSDATNITISAPFTAKAGTTWGCVWDYAKDNGSEVTNHDRVSLAGGSSNMIVLKGGSVNGWTNSGAKRVWFTLIFERA